MDSWTHSFKDRTPNDFEVESKNEAVFVLPASPSYESFLLFKKKHTHFIIQIAFEYKQQEQLDGEGVELTVDCSIFRWLTSLPEARCTPLYLCTSKM